MAQPVSPRAGRERYDDIVDAICAWHEEARSSQVFGMPCVKRSGKVVFGFSRTVFVGAGRARPGRGTPRPYADPAVHARALGLTGAHLFDPSGRGESFRQWVVVPPQQEAEWEALAYEALTQDHTIAP